MKITRSSARWRRRTLAAAGALLLGASVLTATATATAADEEVDPRVGLAPGYFDAGSAASNIELAYVPFYCSWLNRIEPQFTALRYFTLDGTDHQSHREQALMIRRYIAWRNTHVTDSRLRKVIKRASTIKRAKVA